MQPRKYPEDERDIMREDEIAALPTEEERRREVCVLTGSHGSAPWYKLLAMIAIGVERTAAGLWKDVLLVAEASSTKAGHLYRNCAKMLEGLRCAAGGVLLQMRKRREFLKIRREEAKADDGAQVAIPAPDPPLPPTFDADVSAHRYRFLEQPGGWLAR